MDNGAFTFSAFDLEVASVSPLDIEYKAVSTPHQTLDHNLAKLSFVLRRLMSSGREQMVELFGELDEALCHLQQNCGILEVPIFSLELRIIKLVSDAFQCEIHQLSLVLCLG